LNKKSSFEALETGFRALETGFEVVYGGFEAGHGGQTRGSRQPRPQTRGSAWVVLGPFSHFLIFFLSHFSLVWLFLLSFFTFFLD
jgi:hypothetical protein